LILKRAQFIYAIHLHLPFCLCNHILGIILEARDESNTGLPFGYLLTQIILQSGISIAGEPKMKIQDPLSKQTLMKSNAQLRRDDPDDNDVPSPPSIPVAIPSVASFSQTAPPPQPNVSYSQIMKLWQLSREHEFHAVVYVIHAAVHLYHAAEGSLHQPPGRAKPAGPPGVPQLPPPVQ
jgi:hypothetical protein